MKLEENLDNIPSEMVGDVHDNIPEVKVEQEEENLNQDSSELKKSNDPLDLSLLELEYFPGSFVGSIFDFSVWAEDNQNPEMSDVFVSSEEKPSSGVSEKCMEMKKEGGNLGFLIEEEMEKVSLGEESLGVKIEGMALNSSVMDGGESSKVGGGEETGMKDELKKGIEGVEGSEVWGIEENGVKNDAGNVESEEESEEDSSEEESEEEDSSSESSSTSSSEDEDGEEEGEGEERKNIRGEEGEVEIKEGKIRDFDVDEMVAWSDDEDGSGTVVKGPIRSKNEVQDLPPVPPVNLTIEPHHHMLPVGVVLSIMGAQVIVEGVEKHSPLSEGSILWITESRSPLGIVDEIFGPVKNPYYMVRFNFESEVPTGIQQGSLISFVPEFADYVLNNNYLYKKGYDASGENDEELSDEVEFSDDEKEAEYKRMLKMSKRGSNEQKNQNMKKDKKSKNRGGNWKNDHQSSPSSQANMTVQGFSGRPTSGAGMTPAFAPGPQPHNFAVLPSGVWTNGIPSIWPHNISFSPNDFPPNLPFMQQDLPQQPFQNLPLPSTAPFRPQFNYSGQVLPSNFVLQGGLPNFCVGPAFFSWPANTSQNAISQPQVGASVAFQSLISNPSMNVLPQGVVIPNGIKMENNAGMKPPIFGGLHKENTSGTRPPMSSGLQMENNNSTSPPIPNGLQVGNSNGVRPSFASQSGEASLNPNHGNGYPNRGGKKPFQKGSGHFRGSRGGRGRQQSR